MLDVPVVTREWLQELACGDSLSANAPDGWRRWVMRGQYRALTAEPTTVIRSLALQTPDTPLKRDILRCVWLHFENAPLVFERFAAHLYRMVDRRVIIDEITRGAVDGGRDAVGRYLLGLREDPVYAEFSLEAKCYRPPLDSRPPSTVGVKDVSRLISRIRHRQFGVLVATSVIARQAYAEVREDRHPIIFICGRDIAEILIENGYNTAGRVSTLLQDEFRG